MTTAGMVDGTKIEQTPVTTAMPAFRFGGYTLRPSIDSDLDLAARWTQADPDHCDTTEGKFWLRNDGGVNSFVLCDDRGAIFFFRIDIECELPKGGPRPYPKAVSLHMQFAPTDPRERRRLMQAMLIGFGWLEKRLSAAGVDTVYFHSKNPRLILFCEKRLGFAWDGLALVRKIGNG